MSEAQEAPRMPDECGVPDGMAFMHPALKKNYGNWDYHDRPQVGVLHHVAKDGSEVWTVKAGTQRQMDVYTIQFSVALRPPNNKVRNYSIDPKLKAHSNT